MEAEVSIKNLVKQFDKGNPEGYSRNWIDYGNFVSFAVIPSGARLLEVGTGAGDSIPFIKERTNQAIVGDYSSLAVKALSEKYQVRSMVLDGCSLPFEDDYFDIYLSNFVFHNIPYTLERNKFIEEASRVVKPGGICVFGMIPNKLAWLLKPKHYLRKNGREKMFGRGTYYFVYSCKEISNLFADAGLEVLAFRESQVVQGPTRSIKSQLYCDLIKYKNSFWHGIILTKYFDVRAVKIR